MVIFKYNTDLFQKPELKSLIIMQITNMTWHLIISSRVVSNGIMILMGMTHLSFHTYHQWLNEISDPSRVRLIEYKGFRGRAHSYQSRQQTELTLAGAFMSSLKISIYSPDYLWQILFCSKGCLYLFPQFLGIPAGVILFLQLLYRTPDDHRLALTHASHTCSHRKHSNIMCYSKL